MKTIQLTQNRQVIVDDEDYPTLSQFKWSVMATGKKRSNWYAARNEKGKVLYMHRIVTNTIGKKVRVCFINGDTLDCRKDNLCVAKLRKLPGITYYKAIDMWGARIYRNGKTTWLGTFPTQDEASAVYQEAVKQADAKKVK